MFQNLSEEFSEHVLWACLEEIGFHTCHPRCPTRGSSGRIWQKNDDSSTTPSWSKYDKQLSPFWDQVPALSREGE